MQTRRSLFRLFAVAPFAAPAIADTLVSVTTYNQSGGLAILSATNFPEIFVSAQTIVFDAANSARTYTHEWFLGAPVHLTVPKGTE